MATLDDMASEREEQHRDAALHYQQEKAKRNQIKPTGKCIICGEEELPHSKENQNKKARISPSF